MAAVDLFIEAINDLKDHTKDHRQKLLSGGAKDYAEYQFNVGYLMGCEAAAQVIEAAYHKYFKEFKEEGGKNAR